MIVSEDIDNFKILNMFYAKDLEKIYYMGNIVKDVDLKTFKPFTE